MSHDIRCSVVVIVLVPVVVGILRLQIGPAGNTLLQITSIAIALLLAGGILALAKYARGGS